MAVVTGSLRLPTVLPLFTTLYYSNNRVSPLLADVGKFDPDYIGILVLPDKEFRYLRTVIVTAAVHWGFSSHREALPLTFQHWAGVSPYTSTFVLAETCVFGKQLLGLLSCGPVTIPISYSEQYA